MEIQNIILIMIVLSLLIIGYSTYSLFESDSGSGTWDIEEKILENQQNKPILIEITEFNEKNNRTVEVLP